jgi:hypothetical protein
MDRRLDRKETRMTAYAMFAADQALRIANERQAEMRAEAANRRLIASLPTRPGIPARIAAAVASIRTTFAGLTVVDDAKLSVPALVDYPTRS